MSTEVNPAKTWPTAWGKEAQAWAKQHLRNGGFIERQVFVRDCMRVTGGMMNPQVAFNAWDDVFEVPDLTVGYLSKRLQAGA